jgi:hypothetical protein
VADHPLEGDGRRYAVSEDLDRCQQRAFSVKVDCWWQADLNEAETADAYACALFGSAARVAEIAVWCGHKEVSVAHLRKLMLEELERRNYAPSATRCYLRAVDEFARYFNRGS